MSYCGLPVDHPSDAGRSKVPEWQACRVLAGLLWALVLLWPVDLLAQLIRSGVVLVPVDVRVVDERGNPVTDLTVDDFAVYEDDVRQQIAHFQTLSVGPAVRSAATPSSATASSDPLTAPAPTHTFILLLGRGRLNHPAKGLDALIEFVRSGIQPTDRVGIVAYLRVAEPSADHAAAIRFLERYRVRHEDIEGRITADFARTLPFGSPPTVSRATRSAIDDLFAGKGIPAFAPLPGAAGNAASRYLDWNYLRWAMEDARRLAGEKDLVVVAERPLGVAQIRNSGPEHPLVRWASRARVAITSIHTGGLEGQSMVRGRLGIAPGPEDPLTRDAPLRDPADHRMLAELTGGVSSFYQYASKPLDSLERASRFRYLLGYYPKTIAALDARHRLKVVVTRPGVKLLYRHGYQLEPSRGDVEDFRRAAAEARISWALEGLTDRPSYTLLGQPIRHATTLKVVPLATADTSPSKLSVKLAFDGARVAFTHEDGGYRASLYGTVIVDGSNGEPVGELTREFDVTLTPAQLARIEREWLAFEVFVSTFGTPHEVRAALYDYDSDRVMAASAPVRRP